MTTAKAVAEQYESAEQPTPPAGKPPTQAKLLLDIVAADRVELFQDTMGTGFARIPVGEHWEIWPLRSKRFAGWLRRRFDEEYDKPPGSQAISTVRDQLEAQAQVVAERRRVFVRVGEAAGRIYLDLGAPDWSAIEVTGDGWRVVPRPPVMFRRGGGSALLPMPRRGRPLNDLRPFVRVTDEDWPLIVAWLASCLRPGGPFPILVLQGEQGSAKSTTARIVRALVDPSGAALRSAPRDERDLMIAASTNWMLPFDNLSRIPEWLSDALCRLATGGGFATRELYTDADEVVFTAQRPVVLNGIEDLAEREDVRDRSIIVTLTAIPDDQRRDERTLWSEFDAIAPDLLGALLDAVSDGLRSLPTVQLGCLPRMADFAVWATACERGLGLHRGSFMTAYLGNRRRAVELNLELNPLAQAIMTLVASDEWRGTATALLDRLCQVVPESVRKSHDWPKTPRSLSGKLTRAATPLRASGIEVERSRDGQRREIHVYRTPRPIVISVTTVTGVGGAPLVDDGTSDDHGADSVTEKATVCLANDEDDGRDEEIDGR